MNNYNIENIKSDVSNAQKYYKNQDYLKSYSIYKSIYKNYNELRVIPNLVDIAFICIKKNLLKNRKLKFMLINNLIHFGISKDNNTSLSNELIYLKIKLLREFKYYKELEELYLSINKNLQNIIFIQYEILHYLIDIERFEEAEIVLEKLKKNKSTYYNNLENFSLDSKSYNNILNYKLTSNYNSVLFKKEIKNRFKYLVILTCNYEIFKNEAINFINSLYNTSSNYLLVLHVHDASNEELNIITNEINKINLNYIFFVEHSNNYKFNNIQNKTYFTNKRYVLACDLLVEYNKPIFVFDADSIILKDLFNYIKLYENFDMSLHIKKEIRYFDTIVTANQSLFYPSINSKIFLDFFKKNLFYTINNKNIFWQLDQVLLYSSFVNIKRFKKLNFHDNSDNNHKNKESYFYHTFHNKYLL